ncbi:SusC/RagA family TonB-linked outer membrane protein [Pedobacter endophyticus]|uniref:SusC/RagA family TonB-linked outer membrane protein n=1 Tax=Pedobacter endophyticus TaxID=2789740 RepID=A0A7U3Q5A7_9SPHI|nr:SusC/RagA family TonB-linked outer membrane protein [Pedobacter endophyticus]QPH38878.1 SusC/RagA family TonB-linked outer membrane protein [Pedobacter endophyticus]
MRYIYIFVLLGLFFGINQELRAQTKKTVTGTIFDNQAEIPGANISVDKKVIGVTNSNGVFTVSVAPNAVLEISAVGYKTIKISVAGKTNLGTIKLATDVTTLNTVQVSGGYVTRSKEISLGSSVTISGKDLQATPSANITDMLQGKVPGLNIQQNTGSPGVRGSLNIRGLSTISTSGAGNDAYLQPTSPLFVIDGVPVDDNQDFSYGFQTAGPGLSPLALIPQEDVASIEVLKDASATALYGSRGAYGVILITTKRGNSKVPIVRYTGKFFVSTVPKLRSVIGGKDERALRIQQILASDTSYYHALGLINGTPFISDSLNVYLNNSTDWQSYFYRTTYNQTHNLDISGGDQAFNYKAVLNYFDQKGIQQNTGFSRYSLRMNMQYQPNEKFKLFATINSGLGKQRKGSGNGLINTGIATGGASSSLLPPPSLYSSVNSVLGSVSTDNDNKTIDLNSTIELRYQIIKNLSITSNFNYTLNTGTEDNFRPAIISDGTASLFAFNSVKNAIYNRNLLQYNVSWGGITEDDDHNILAYVFNDVTSTNFKADALQNDKIVNDFLRGPIVPQYGFRQSLGGTLNNFYQTRAASFAGSFTYSYKRRYVLNSTYRFDGSSSNGPEAGYTKSPSIGLKWNLNNEAFMQGTKNWLDYIFAQVTYGTVIQPSGGVYDVYGRYVSAANYNGTSSVAISSGRAPNTNLQPIKNTTYNFNFEFGVLKSRLRGSFDAYYKQTDNLFGAKALSNVRGFEEITNNESALVNIGYEGSLTASLLPNESKSRFTISVNGAINNDYLVALPNGVRQRISIDEANGQSILTRLGTNALSNFIYNTKGVYANTADVPVDPLTGLRYRVGSGSGNLLNYFRAGDPRYTDVNGDYIFDGQDLVDAGSSQINFSGGVTLDFRYERFSAQVQGTCILGRDILNNALAAQFQAFSNPVTPSGLVPISEYDIWTHPGQVAKYPNPYDYLRSGIVFPYRYAQTLFQEDGSFFKLNYITLGYTLNPKFTQRIGMTRIAIGATASNLFMISNYSGPNPEAVSALGRDSSGGYPVPKTFTVNLNIEF